MIKDNIGRGTTKYYCSKCSQIIFERLEKERKEPDKLAEYYVCQMGDIPTEKIKKLLE